MAERASVSPLSARTAGLCLLAGLLGALAGAHWTRRAAFFPAAAVLPPAARVSPAGLAPIVELSPDAAGSVPIRADSRNLFGFTESPSQRDARLNGERLARLEALKREQDLIERRKREQVQIEADIRWHQARPEPPPVTLALIGKMGKPASPMAILAAPDGEVYFARPGETVAGRFRLLRLDFDAVTIGYADTLVASQPEWAGRTTVLRMSSR